MGVNLSTDFRGDYPSIAFANCCPFALTAKSRSAHQTIIVDFKQLQRKFHDFQITTTNMQRENEAEIERLKEFAFRTWRDVLVDRQLRSSSVRKIVMMVKNSQAAKGWRVRLHVRLRHNKITLVSWMPSSLRFTLYCLALLVLIAA